MHSSRDIRASVRAAAARDGNVAVAPLLEGPRTEARSRLDGFREGRDEGFRVGLSEGRDRGRAELQSAVSAIDGLVEDLRRRCQEDRAVVEELAIRLAVELAETVIGHELTADPGGTLIARAMSLRTGREQIAIHLHPDDAAAIEAIEHRDVQLVADPTCPRGSALAEYGDGFADISIDTAMARVREALG